MFEDRSMNTERDSVTLATIHQVKGLEYKVVFFINLDGNVIPSRRATDKFEERRIFYVGITRAKEILYLVSNDRIASSFLRDMRGLK